MRSVRDEELYIRNEQKTNTELGLASRPVIKGSYSSQNDKYSSYMQSSAPYLFTIVSKKINKTVYPRVVGGKYKLDSLV
jgi:hypothetical protein